MKENKKGFTILESGTDCILGGHRCVCSDGGHATGQELTCGCWCACQGDSSTRMNLRANIEGAGNCDPLPGELCWFNRAQAR